MTILGRERRDPLRDAVTLDLVKLRSLHAKDASAYLGWTRVNHNGTTWYVDGRS